MKYFVMADFDEILVTFRKNESLLDFVNRKDKDSINQFVFLHSYVLPGFKQDFSTIPRNAGNFLSSINKNLLKYQKYLCSEQKPCYPNQN